jgi:hypothetical protein
MVARSIVSVSDSLPEAVRTLIPAQAAVNVYEYTILIRSTGRKPLSEVKLELVPDEDTVLLGHEIHSVPPRGVEWLTDADDNELILRDIALTRDQELVITLFAKSSGTPKVRPYFGGGGSEPPEFEEVSRQEYQGIERHVASIIRNYVASIVAPAVVGAIGSILVGTVAVIGQGGPIFGAPAIQIGAAGFLQVLGALINAYFLLRIVPPALALVRILVNRRADSSAKLVGAG